VFADIAFAFGWSRRDLAAEYWDELLRWHAEVQRIYREMRGRDV